MRIYLDSAVVIYTVEQVTPFAAVVDSRLSERDIVTVASPGAEEQVGKIRARRQKG